MSLIAAQHLTLLVSAGHIVSIIGSNIPAGVNKNLLPASAIFHVSSSGSGALYSRASVDTFSLKNALLESDPDVVIVEAWQTALTDAAVEISFELGLPVLMISHGVSMHPFTFNVSNLLRSFGWVYYRFKSLPKLISRLSAITTLDEESCSDRFFDRDLAHHLGVPVLPLVNSPVNWRYSSTKFYDRKRQILVVGYFSAIKNQLAAIELFASLPANLHLRFIGNRTGNYYLKCFRRVVKLGLEKRVFFSQDNEVDLANEISNSIIVLSTSITEVLPVTLIESMASGTPFVTTAVGATPSMGAGIIANNEKEQRQAILSLLNDPDYWTRLSETGRHVYNSRYTLDHVRKNLLAAIETTTNNFK